MQRPFERLWFALPKIFLPLAAVLLIWGLLAVVRAPLEALQGPPQKIFYLHVPLAWTAFILFGGAAIAGVVYLVRRAPFWDQAGHGLASAGYLTITGVLVTGPIWAKPIWGTFWVWEPRLTTTFLLWLIYGGYFLVRWLRGNDGWTARACAILAVFAFADVPIIHLSVLWWRTLHPSPVVMQKGNVGAGLAPEMREPLMLMFAALLVLGLGLAALRSQLRRREDALTPL